MNIFDDIKVGNDKEEFIDILKNENIRIERIVSNGQKSQEDFWYDQDENEFVILLEGEAILEFEDKEVKLSKGDYCDIKAHIKHRVKYTSLEKPTIWLAVFY